MGRNSIEKTRKPQILEYFRQVVNDEGLHKASVAKIAKRMGVSPNLVLHYFDSKEAMVLELFDVIMNQYIEYLSKAITNVPAGPQRLKMLIKTMFGLGRNRDLLSEKSYYAFYYMGLFDEQLSARFNQKYKQFTEIVIREIESCAKPENPSQVDVARQAEFLLSLFEGFTFKAAIRTKGDYFEEMGSYFFEKACGFFELDMNE
ncbi:MAG: hypothetical protein BA863_02025 [Desulfovibrio sp. S3730MH75]|nr:MAG: hypothetical protein BA863_02025 [Desulfovibrio sp. S3730MH75]